MKATTRYLLIFVILLALATAVLFLFLYPFHAWRFHRPNVVLITIDALRADHLGCYGYSRRTSPDINRIASEGIVFTNAIAAAPWTSPSVTSLMTSTYPLVHRIDSIGEILAPGIPLLAELLSEKGIKTAAFVNQPLLMKPSGHELDRGFATYKSNYASRFKPQDQLIGDYLLTDDAIQWLRSHTGTNFFLWIHYMNPHEPYTPPSPYDTVFLKRDRYHTGAQTPLLGKLYMFGFISMGHARFVNFSTDVDTYVARYDGEIRLVNDDVRRLYAELKSLNLLSDTTIIITADHGESLGENDWYFTHGMTFEANIRVPLIVKLAGNTDPRRIDALVSLIDIAPTILDMMGISPPGTFEGTSLLPLIRGDTETVRSFAYGNGGHMIQEYIRTPKFKLAIKRPPVRSDGTNPYENYFDGREEIVELYDIVSDPFERKNITREKPVLTASMAAQLREWKATQEKKAQHFNPGSPETAPLDKKAKKILRDLGYIR